MDGSTKWRVARIERQRERDEEREREREVYVGEETMRVNRMLWGDQSLAVLAVDFAVRCGQRR